MTCLPFFFIWASQHPLNPPAPDGGRPPRRPAGRRREEGATSKPPLSWRLSYEHLDASFTNRGQPRRDDGTGPNRDTKLCLNCATTLSKLAVPGTVWQLSASGIHDVAEVAIAGLCEWGPKELSSVDHWILRTPRTFLAPPRNRLSAISRIEPYRSHQPVLEIPMEIDRENSSFSDRFTLRRTQYLEIETGSPAGSRSMMMPGASSRIGHLGLAKTYVQSVRRFVV